MLTLNQVSKIYRIGTFGGKELRAVCDVSFDIKDGEIVSLIGESGSGKSTIGKMILRLISITAGTIIFDGDNISTFKGGALKDYYRRVQGVFQDPFSSYNPIFKADRIFQIIHDEFFPDINGEQWSDKVHSSLESVGLNPAHVLHKFPHQLSGGQLQRFLIARALLLDTRFLVADEIISMLDASTRIDVLNLVAELKKRCCLSLLFITHDLSLAYYVSDRAVILYRGCVVEMGATDKVYNNSLHPYTRMLMVSIPRLDQKWTEGEKKNGLTTKQLESSAGCVYYDRCPDAEWDCAQNRPPLIEIEDDHFVACYHYQTA
jgi:peptide/nickel transport system ATP-binding protein